MDGGAWRATIHGVARVGHDLVTQPPPPVKAMVFPVVIYGCKS